MRDIYDVDADHLLIVTTDRLSAFDVVLPDPIPCKGEVLTRISLFWFARTRHIVANHLSPLGVLEDVVADPPERAQLAGRAMVVRKLRALPLEAVVRGYLIGSGFKDYQSGGRDVRHRIAARPCRWRTGCRNPCSRRPRRRPPASTTRTSISTPWSALVGTEHADAIRRIALEIYRHSPPRMRARATSSSPTPSSSSGSTRGGRLLLIDEVLTPDSSRFWPVASYRPGISPPSFDKQFVRDYLESLHWNKRPPAPHLPRRGDRAHQRQLPPAPGAADRVSLRSARASRPSGRRRAAHSPAMVISSSSTEPTRTPPRASTSSPTATMPRSIVASGCPRW